MACGVPCSHTAARDIQIVIRVIRRWVSMDRSHTEHAHPPTGVRAWHPAHAPRVCSEHCSDDWTPKNSFSDQIIQASPADDSPLAQMRGKSAWPVVADPCPQRAESDGREVLSVEWGGRCSAGSSAARGVRPLADRTLPAGRKKQAGAEPFRGAKLSIVVSAFVSHSSESLVSVAAGEPAAGKKIRRSRCTKSTAPRTR